jgi:hypothetical protein
MKSAYTLFRDAWNKKEEREWQYVYVMMDLHGTIIPSNYHTTNDLDFVNASCKKVLQYLNKQEDVVLILWTSSYSKEIDRSWEWLVKNQIQFDYVNKNPLEKNNKYADFTEKPYFTLLIDDKAGWEPEDWKDVEDWIADRELDKLK